MRCSVLPHITAGVFIHNDERTLLSDYEKWLEELDPHAPVNQHRRHRTGEDACLNGVTSRPILTPSHCPPGQV
jgi:thiamine phosphate synthase YjbQ (UPF0047 family)